MKNGIFSLIILFSLIPCFAQHSPAQQEEELAAQQAQQEEQQEGEEASSQTVAVSPMLSFQFTTMNSYDAHARTTAQTAVEQASVVAQQKSDEVPRVIKVYIQQPKNASENSSWLPAASAALNAGVLGMQVKDAVTSVAQALPKSNPLKVPSAQAQEILKKAADRTLKNVLTKQ